MRPPFPFVRSWKEEKKLNNKNLFRIFFLQLVTIVIYVFFFSRNTTTDYIRICDKTGDLNTKYNES